MSNPALNPCFYCNLNTQVDESEHFIRMMKIGFVRIYLHRDQSYPGRAIVASNDHYSDVTEMPADVAAAFFHTAYCMSKAIQRAFPETVKINMVLCGNAPEMQHPHIHLLPRHVGDRHWPHLQLDYELPYWPDGDSRYGSTIAKMVSALEM